MESSQVKGIIKLIDKVNKGELIIDENSRIYRKLKSGKIKHTEYKTSDGYYRISITVKNKQIYILSHRFLYALYHGIEMLDSSLTINHIDHDKQNNKKSNLEQITSLENVMDGIAYQKLIAEEKAKLIAEAKEELIAEEKKPKVNIRKIQPVSFNLDIPSEEKLYNHIKNNNISFSQYVKSLIQKDIEK